MKKESNVQKKYYIGMIISTPQEDGTLKSEGKMTDGPFTKKMAEKLVSEKYKETGDYNWCYGPIEQWEKI